jgi:hypothetical protein
MSRPEYKQLNLKLDDHAFFEEFAKKLSAQLGIDLTIVQALRKAVTHYKTGMSKKSDRDLEDLADRSW